MDKQKSPYSPEVMQRLPSLVKAYQLPDNGKAVTQILTSFLPFLAIWVLMYLLLNFSIPLVLLLAAVNAFFLVRIFIIQHDCGHQSFFGSRKANNVIGMICSVFSILPFRYWAKSHNFHHAHNGLLWEHRDIGDIQTLTVQEFAALSRFKRLRYILFRSVPVQFILGPIWYLFIVSRLPLIDFKGWKPARRALLRHNLWLVATFIGLTLIFGWKAVVLIHLPILFFFGVIAVWFFYVQHQHETAYKQWKDKWDYVRAAIEGSTFYRLPRVFQWLTGNIGYHHIHHLNPQVPNYQLARCHRENPVLARLAKAVTFPQSLRFIFHKLWDEDQQRMISFREYFRRRKAGKLAPKR